MFWAFPVSHGPDRMGLHNDCSSDAHKHSFPFFCCGSKVGLEIVKPGCMEGASTAYKVLGWKHQPSRSFQQDQRTCSLSGCMFLHSFSLSLSPSLSLSLYIYIYTVYTSAHLITIPLYYSKIRYLHLSKDIVKLEMIQHRATKNILNDYAPDFRFP